MNKIRHIAIASRDPGKTAEFYKKTLAGVKSAAADKTVPIPTA